MQVRILDKASGSKSALGSGFFVDGAGHLITNFHVLKRVIEGKAKPADVAFRFDYKRVEDGTTVNPGTVFSMPAIDWLIDSSGV